MKTIAITGGIGSGKSAVTAYLTELGYTVVDADRMSREMTSAGGKAIPYIREHFGPEFLLEDRGGHAVQLSDGLHGEGLSIQLKNRIRHSCQLLFSAL